VTALPAHASLEVYSVLTRLPSGLAVSAATAAEVLTTRFPGTPLEVPDRLGLIGRLAARGIFGGASYDGLVASEAAANDAGLLTLDERAQMTYRRLGIVFTVI
jgi:hypothetical protein